MMRGLIPFVGNRPDYFDSFFDDFYNMLDDFFADSRLYRRHYAGTFRVDVKDNGDDYTIVADMPGVKKDEIDVTVKDGTLCISVNRNEEREDKNDKYIHRERRCCAMSRSIYLGDIDQVGITAKLEDGVLRITVPKKEPKSNTFKVDIQ